MAKKRKPQPKHSAGNRSAWVQGGLVGILLAAGLWWCYRTMFWMPQSSFSGALPAADPRQKQLATQLHRDVAFLAGEGKGSIGERHLDRLGQLAASAKYIEGALKHAGHSVQRLPCPPAELGVVNLQAERLGISPNPRLYIVGAHYDSNTLSPGADDNASGVAANLALARHFTKSPLLHTVRFVFFANGAKPCFQTAAMGSHVYAQQCKQKGEKIEGVICLDSLGYYSSETGSQRLPAPLTLLTPPSGDFVAFVGNLPSAPLVRTVVGEFRNRISFPSRGAVLPEGFSAIGQSDHWAFWYAGYPAMLVTDTQGFRNPYYQQQGDRADRIDYDSMSRVVEGLAAVLETLCTRK